MYQSRTSKNTGYKFGQWGMAVGCWEPEEVLKDEYQTIERDDKQAFLACRKFDSMMYTCLDMLLYTQLSTFTLEIL